MRNVLRELPIVFLILAMGAMLPRVGHCDDTETPIEEDSAGAQPHRVGSTDVVVLNAEGTPDQVRRETVPLITALLTLTKVGKDEKCTAVLWSRAPTAKCAIIKAKKGK